MKFSVFIVLKMPNKMTPPAFLKTSGFRKYREMFISLKKLDFFKNWSNDFD